MRVAPATTGSLYRMTIGGVTLSIDLQEESDNVVGRPGYSDFLQYGNDSCDEADIYVVVRKGTEQLSKDNRVVFSCTPSWVMHQAQGGFFISWGKQPEPGKLRWGAWTNSDFSKVDLFFDPTFFPYIISDKSLIRFVQYPLDQILFMHRLLISHKGTIIHSAGGELWGYGLVFPGVSGSGKSTLCRLLASQDECRVFSDDRIIIHRDDNSWRLNGTPWPGEEEIAVNAQSELRALLFLDQADETKVVSLKKDAALHTLCNVCSIPWYDEKLVNSAFDLVHLLISEVPLYTLRFKKDEEVGDILHQFVSMLDSGVN